MPRNHDRVPIPPKEDMNRNLSSAREQTMIEVFGRPGRLTRNCSDPTGDFARRVVTQNVGPFRVTGFDLAVGTLERIFAEVRTEHRDVFDEVKTEGMLCVRHRRNNPTRFSNHSWGCAIDLFFGAAVIDQSEPVAHWGNVMLFPFFNKHGWYWGAEFSGSSVDSMHFELAEETIRKIARGEPLDGGRGGGGVAGPQQLHSAMLSTDPVLVEVAAGDRVLRRSDARQPGVGTLQDALNRLGAQNPALRIDLGPDNRHRGFFGPQMEAAVRALQAAQRIGVDGVVGMDTIAALDRALLELAAEPIGGEAGGLRGGELPFRNINATEFGGGSESGMPSAYGGVVHPDKPEASLPARLPRERRRIVVRNPANSRSVECKINDVGPWNIRDPYWDEGRRPLAESQFRDGIEAQNGDVPTNDAGLDLTPAAMNALGVAGPVNTRQVHVDWDFI